MRAKKKDFSPEERAKILKLYKSGVSGQFIRERFGCGHDYPQRLLREEQAAQAKSEENAVS